MKRAFIFGVLAGLVTIFFVSAQLQGRAQPGMQAQGQPQVDVELAPLSRVRKGATKPEASRV